MAQNLYDLTASELRALAQTEGAAQTVIFFAVGAPDTYGPHLPLRSGLDHAFALCERLAARLEADRAGVRTLLVPPLALGMDHASSSFGIPVRAHVLRDALIDQTKALSKLGFRNFVCVSGQRGPKQLTTIEEVSKFFGLWGRKKIVFASVSSSLISLKEVLKSPFWAFSSEHAGERDTSIALAIRPDSVRAEYLHLAEQTGPTNALEALLSRWGQRSDAARYWGAPAQATAEKGEAYLSLEIDRIYPLLVDVLDQRGRAHRVFRSWASIIPGNGSFFKAWVLMLGALGLFLFWLAWVGSVLPL